MSEVSRRAVAFGALSIALPGLGLPTSACADEIRAAPLRSIDPLDEDWSDLAPIGDAIGSARIVQLGEPGHGAGSAFGARTRIVKFLHAALGFDVVIWESGLYDVALTQAALRAGEADAAHRGVFPFWARAEQIAPLFAYARATQASVRPLEMAGFDVQVTARGSRDRFSADLRAFVAPLNNAPLGTAAEEALAARARLYDTSFQSAEDLAALVRAIETLQVGAPVLQASSGASHAGFMMRAIENMRVDAQLRFDRRRAPAPTVAWENRRDALNAQNARWLIEERFRGRKVVIWAHNAHVMNAYYAANFRDVSVRRRADHMKPTGVFLKEWYGADVFTIGVTAYEGEDRMIGVDRTTRIEPAPAGSLEAQLHALGHATSFVNLRGRGRGDALRRPIVARAPKYESVPIEDIGRVYDGLVFIDRMAPAVAAA